MQKDTKRRGLLYGGAVVSAALLIFLGFGITPAFGCDGIRNLQAAGNASCTITYQRICRDIALCPAAVFIA